MSTIPVWEVVMKCWNDEEVKALFCEVENCKTKQKALREAFVLHAQKFNRKPNSVRNYYYHEIDNLKKDEIRNKKLQVDLSKHIKTHFQNFDKYQEEELFEKIEKYVENGMSVRGACLKLSKGDLLLMTRYQNKYQNMKRKIQSNNIIPFKQQSRTLSDNEINSLFLGLVKLIKKSAQEEINSTNRVPEQLLKKSIIDLNKENKEISTLKFEYEKLKKENSELLSKIKQNKKEAFEAHILKNRISSGKENTKRV